MDELFFFAIWAGLIIWIAQNRVGADIARHGDKRARGETWNAATRKSRWIQPERDTDPVCGNSVRTNRAKPSVHDGNVYYFCSRDCREIFEAAPELYLRSGDSGRSELGHSHA